MAIHTNLPFIVDFNVLSNDGSYINKDKSFSINSFHDYSNIEIEEVITFFEYDYLTVEFKPVNNYFCMDTKLYMDYFEYLAEDNGDVKFDEENNAYINLGNKATIHTHMNNYTGIPLVPGLYNYKIFHKDMYYYGMFEILPKNIDKKVHNKMIEQIENISLGLSRDFFGKSSIFENLNVNINVSNLDKVLFILSNKSKLLNSLNILKTNLEKTNENKYIKVNKPKNLRHDYKSIKLNSNKGIDILRVNRGEINEVFQKVIKESINTNENRFVLFVLKLITKQINESKKDLLSIKGFVNNEILNLKKYKNNILLLQKRSEQQDRIDFINTELININNKITEFTSNYLNVTATNFCINTKIMRTPGYRDLYYFYRNISKEMTEINNSLIDYKWKTTDLIYEYWCFLELVNIFLELNFEISSGWIFGDNVRTIRSEIEEGTTIEFSKDNITVKLIYNKEIKKYNNISENYWTRDRHNKPDFRIDIYLNENFNHAIILDSKYSPAEKIWKKNKNGFGQQTKVVTQLNMYKNMIVSTKEKDKYVVKEVIALTPTLFDDDRDINIDNNYSVTVATFNPSLRNENLIERIRFLVFDDFINK